MTAGFGRVFFVLWYEDSMLWFEGISMIIGNGWCVIVVWRCYVGYEACVM